MQNTRYIAEAFPILNPNLGPDWFATGYGAQLKFGEITSWADHTLTDRDVESYKGFVLDTQNVYYQKMDEIININLLQSIRKEQPAGWGFGIRENGMFQAVIFPA